MPKSRSQDCAGNFNNSDDLRQQCDELVLVAVKKHLAQGNNISPQFPVLVMMDIFYAYYMI